jgi:poly-gamma-glutamate system protein
VGKLATKRDGYRPLAFLLSGVLAIGLYALAVRIPDGSIPGSVLDARRLAVRNVRAGQDAIREERRRLGLRLAPGDRLGTGLVGIESSPVTTELGSLSAKRTSTDPLFAAAVVDMLYRAGVRSGDVVAVGMSGSFPAFDLDVIVATEALGADPIILSSVGSSQYGANHPKLTWPAMERALLASRVIHHRSSAADAGGPESTSGQDPDAALRRSLAEDAGLPILPPLPLDEEVAYRVAFYDRAAASRGRPIRAFVNVGGSAVDVGAGGAGEALIAPGLSHPQLGPYETSKTGVIGRMAARHLPIINLVDVSRLAGRYDIPWDPKEPSGTADLPGPPPSPIALAIALAVLLAAVAGAHRGGLYRVPVWELPPQLLHEQLTELNPTPTG